MRPVYDMIILVLHNTSLFGKKLIMSSAVSLINMFEELYMKEDLDAGQISGVEEQQHQSLL